MRFARDLRLIPVVALAAAALFLLKVSAIVVEGGYTLIASRAALAQGFGEGQTAKDIELPPPAALDDAAPEPRGDRARSWVRDIYAPEYSGSVAAKVVSRINSAVTKGRSSGLTNIRWPRWFSR